MTFRARYQTIATHYYFTIHADNVNDAWKQAERYCGSGARLVYLEQVE